MGDDRIKLIEGLKTQRGLTDKEAREFTLLFDAVQKRIEPVIKLKPHNRAMYLFKMDIIERDVRERFDNAHHKNTMMYADPQIQGASQKIEAGLITYALEYAERRLKQPLLPGQATLENYCALMDSITTAARDEPGSVRELDGTPSAQARAHISGLWAALRTARIFDFPVATYLDVYRAVDIYVTEKIVKKKWRVADDDLDRDGLKPEDVDEYIEKTSVAGQSVPFPDPLPFDSVYMGFDQGVMLTPQSLRLRIPDKVRRESVRYGVVLGFLLHQTSTGPMAYEISYILQEDGDNYHLPLPLTNLAGMWENPAYTLAPWLLTHFISMINEHRTIIAEQKPTFALRRDFEQTRKKFRMPSMIPKPYYLVRMEKKLITDHVERQHKELSRIARELSYRHDRRGHERCYVRRGKHPLSVKDSQKMHEAGYTIWTVDEPDANAYRQLMERGYPPKAADEWLAILTRWIDPQIIGPEDKPYIPAIRLPAKVE